MLTLFISILTLVVFYYTIDIVFPFASESHIRFLRVAVATFAFTLAIIFIFEGLMK